jgi:phosphonatase-like hydrolase
MNPELIMFDLAGTTVKDNHDVHRALQHALAKFGVLISLAEANAVMGIPKPVAIRTLLNTCDTAHGPITEDLVQEIHHTFVEEMIHFYQEDPSVAEKDGVSDTFRKLKERKLKVAIDTGFDRQITDSILQRLGWLQKNLIDASVTSDEVPRGRPYPDLIFKAMELTHVTDSKSVAKVGDTTSDLLEGNSAGCGWVIGVTTGAYTRSELQKEKHTHLIENVHEVLGIFDLNVD